MTTGSVDAKPGGHSRSPLERHKQSLLDLVARASDLTLAEISARLRLEKKQKAGIGSIWCFFDRHDITFKMTLRAASRIVLTWTAVRRPFLGRWLGRRKNCYLSITPSSQAIYATA